MQILDNLIIIILPVIGFIAGKKVADAYNSNTIEELRYLLRLNAAQHGVGYIPPPVKRRRRNILGQDFMDKLHEVGRATQQVRNS